MSHANFLLPPPNADVVDPKQDPLPYRALHSKSSAFSRKLKIYTDLALLCNAKIESGEPLTEDDGNRVVLSQRLLRNFVFTKNWIHEAKEFDRYTIPDAVKTALEKLIGADLVTKYQEALRAKRDEVAQILPKEDQLEESKWKAVVTYVQHNEKAMVVSVLQKAIAEMKQELESRKDEQQPKRVAKKQSESLPSKTVWSSDEFLPKPEQKFKDLASDIRARIGKLKFEPDDYKQYSEVQFQLDTLLFETADEVKLIKKSLKKQFDEAQNPSSPKKMRSRRKPRNG